jgi:hypothetical protein
VFNRLIHNLWKTKVSLWHTQFGILKLSEQR